ncbi:MAG: hypothetical protein ACRDHL_07435 [Candidatus Promineifilaceae bacterium]
MKLFATVMLFATVLLAACSPGNLEPPAGRPEGPDPAGDQPESGQTGDPVPPAATVNLSELTPAGGGEGGENVEAPMPGSPDSEARMTAIASQDLSARTGVDVSEISLVSAEAKEWPTSSLGCPDVNKMYAQVVTPGFALVLEADGEQYKYHTDTEDHVVLCVDGHPAAPAAAE